MNECNKNMILLFLNARARLYLLKTYCLLRFVTFKDFTQGHMHIGHEQIQRGAGDADLPSWNPQVSVENSNWTPLPWKSVGKLSQ